MLFVRRHPLRLLIGALDVLAIGVSLLAAFLVRSTVLPRYFGLWQGELSLFPNYQLLLLGSLPVLLVSLHLSRAYHYDRIQSRVESLLSVTRATLLSSVFIFAFGFSLRDKVFSRSIILLFLAFANVSLFLVRVLFCRIDRILERQPGQSLTNAVVVGTSRSAQDLAQRLISRPYLGYRVLGHVSVPNERNPDPGVAALCSIEDLPDLVDKMVVDDVLFGISLDEATIHEQTIWKLEEVGTTVHLRGDAVGVLLSHMFVSEFDGIPILTLKSTPADPLALLAKRAIDIGISALALVMLSPVLLCTAMLIRITSKGPVLYRQERVGLYGRRFTMLKFRSMVQGAESRIQEVAADNEMSGPVFKMTNDPRITSIGRWTRKFSIDELPQLWNVLVGDMSLVGPRPPLPHEVDRYERWQRRRLSMKPGITCLWQVNGRNNVDFDTWMKLDMAYIDNWSLGQDLRILLKTVPVVLLARGAK